MAPGSRQRSRYRSRPGAVVARRPTDPRLRAAGSLELSTSPAPIPRVVRVPRDTSRRTPDAPPAAPPPHRPNGPPATGEGGQNHTQRTLEACERLNSGPTCWMCGTITPEAFHSKAWGCRACGYPRFETKQDRTPEGFHTSDVETV